jgi:hypothetical protein
MPTAPNSMQDNQEATQSQLFLPRIFGDPQRSMFLGPGTVALGFWSLMPQPT